MSTAATRTAQTTDGKEGGGLTLPIAGIACAVVLILVGAILAGRRDEPVPTAYGRRRGGEAGRSVNGTAVLADMFRARGHTVTTMSRFSPGFRWAAGSRSSAARSSPSAWSGALRN